MKYSNSTAFRMALDDRLKNRVSMTSTADIDVLRKAVVTERFLARLLVVAPNRWLLKGGVSLDYRLADRARTTIDLDIESLESDDQIVMFVQHAATLDLGDYLTFIVRQRPLKLSDEGATALRFSIEASIGGKRFENTVLDVGIREEFHSDGDKVTSSNLLDFAGIHPVEILAISLEQHIAEKLHAFSRIYAHDRPSSRVKDLVDMVLIVSEYDFQAGSLMVEIERTFDGRKMQELPPALVRPPDFWTTPYRQMAGEIGLDPDIDHGFRLATMFFDPVLVGAITENDRWTHETLEWTDR